MIDAVGNPQSLLLLGGSSEIGIAVAAKFAAVRPLRVVLAGRPGEVVGRTELLERVWGTTYSGFEHSIEQAVHEIRRSLKEPGWIETVRGIGYKFVPQP